MNDNLKPFKNNKKNKMSERDFQASPPSFQGIRNKLEIKLNTMTNSLLFIVVVEILALSLNLKRKKRKSLRKIKLKN